MVYDRITSAVSQVGKTLSNPKLQYRASTLNIPSCNKKVNLPSDAVDNKPMHYEIEYHAEECEITKERLAQAHAICDGSKNKLMGGSVLTKSEMIHLQSEQETISKVLGVRSIAAAARKVSICVLFYLMCMSVCMKSRRFRYSFELNVYLI